jgi:nicotinate-nucleotide adenylyltransferase
MAHNKESQRMAKIGLYCGTFNPIHLGHLLIAESARGQFALNKVIFVTSPQPPHRNDELLAAKERHDMVSKAVADNPFFEASDLEIKRDGPSYTADTVRSLLKESQEDVELFLILGGDNLPQLINWHDSDYLLKKCHFLVAPRTVYVAEDATEKDLQTISKTNDISAPDESVALPAVEPIQRIGQTRKYALAGGRVSVIDFPHVAISSSAVRTRIKKKQSVLYMVPKSVADVIAEKSFYCET